MKAKILFLCFMLMFAINSYGQSGQDGNISWSIEDRTLTFTGTGNMKNYDFKRMSPWSSYSEQIEKVIIGDGVTNIGNCAFCGCSSIVSIEIPNSVTSIGGQAFYECISLTSIDISGVTSIGSGAFAGCTNLTGIDIPVGVTDIRRGTFAGCYKLKSIIIPNGVTSIGELAFIYCYSLIGVAIPNSVTSIGNEAFGHCTNLSIVGVYWEKPISLSESVFYNTPVSKVTLIVPEGTEDLYKAANNWKNFGTIDCK